MAKATEELVAELTERHSKQVESIIKSNSEATEKLTAAILANKPAATSTTTNKSAKAHRGRKRKGLQRHVLIVIANTRIVRMINAGSYQPTQPSAQPIGNPLRALDNARGLQ